MTVDDTSREALVEQVARTWYDSQGFHAADSWDAETRLNREANYLPHAEAVVDAVVMPLVQGRDMLKRIANGYRDECVAVIRRAEEAEAALEAVRARLADDQPVANVQTDVYAILDRFS